MKRAIAVCIGVLLAGVMSVNSAHAMIAAEEYGWYDGYTPPSSMTGGSNNFDPACWTGMKTLCETKKTSTCVEWRPTSGSLGIAEIGGTASYGLTCKTTIETTIYKYYP